MTNEELFALVKRVDPQAVRLPPGLIAIAAEIELIERERWRTCTANLLDAVMTNIDFESGCAIDAWVKDARTLLRHNAELRGRSDSDGPA